MKAKNCNVAKKLLASSLIAAFMLALPAGSFSPALTVQAEETVSDSDALAKPEIEKIEQEGDKWTVYWKPMEGTSRYKISIGKARTIGWTAEQNAKLSATIDRFPYYTSKTSFTINLPGQAEMKLKISADGFGAEETEVTLGSLEAAESSEADSSGTNTDTSSTEEPNETEEALDSVIRELYNAENKNVSFDGGSFARVPEEYQADIYEMIQGTDRTVSFAFSKNGQPYSWTFNGKDMTAASSKILVDDFDIEMSKENAEIQGKLPAGTANALCLHFAHDGELPANATVSVSVDGFGFADGTILNLYYYNPATQSLQLADSNIKVTGQTAVFHISHCSDYVLTTAAAGSVSPKTGENGQRMWALCLTAAFTGGICTALAVLRKKRNITGI